MKNLFLFLIISSVLFAGCQSKYRGIPGKYTKLLDSAYVKAGANAETVFSVLKNVANENKEAAAFLIAYMPENDLKTLSSEFIADQIEWSGKVRNEFEWCRNLPDSIYFNEILPYYNLDEARDNWRENYYNRFSPYVKGCRNIYEAIDSINLNIRDELEVDYNTKRSIVNISPMQAEKEKMATCTGLSFLLVNAFRSVGIPARIAGTPLWTNMRGNHNWVEVWIDGEWYFTEYYPDALNKSWFLTDAGKADPGKPIHWIYAASYKPADTYFPRVWERGAKDIHAVNVTDRYIRLYQEQLTGKPLKENELIIDVVLYKNPDSDGANNRISEKVTVWQGEKEIDFGFTPSSKDDLNKYLKFKLEKNTNYRFEFTDAEGNEKSVTHTFNDESANILKLVQVI